MTPEETAVTLEKMRNLYPIPNQVENRDGFLAEYGKGLKLFPLTDAMRAVDWLFQNRPQRSWPMIAEFRQAVKDSAPQIEKKGRWLSTDEKYARGKKYANDWLNTIDGEELRESEPELVDWAFHWIIEANMENDPEAMVLPNAKILDQLRAKQREWQVWFDTIPTNEKEAEKHKEHQETLMTGRQMKLRRLKTEGVYM